MPIILYSDQRVGTSDAVDDHLLRLLQGTGHRIGFIPAATDRNNRYLLRAREHYASLGLLDVLPFDVGLDFQAGQLESLLACDAIHLSGGEPAPFLEALRARGMARHLRSFLEKGGVIIGVSAGAMVLGRTLLLCEVIGELPKKGNQRDSKRRPDTGRKARSGALGIVGFDFWPHFYGSGADAAILQAHSKDVGVEVYACHDTEGVVLEGEVVHCVGDVAKFSAQASVPRGKG